MLVYGVGDYLEFWDEMFGRTLALKGLERLASTEGTPIIIIFDDEPEFHPLYKIINSTTQNEDAIQKVRKGIIPTCIVRIGHTVKPDVGDDLPEGWPNPNFVPESMPVMYVYNYTKKNFLSLQDISIKSTLPVGSLGDIRRSIEDLRNQERFIVTTIVIGLLSIAVVILDVSRKKDN